MRLEDRLSSDTKKAMYKKANRNRKKKKEKLSFKDIEHMMGKYKDTLHRGKGGAWK